MLGLADKKNLMEVYINPMIAENLLSMTEPSNPTSRNQMYVATKTKSFNCICKRNHLYPNGASRHERALGSPILRFEV